MKPGFEIPVEMKQLAERGIETARQAFQGYFTAVEKTLGMIETSTGAHADVRDISRKAMGYAQENVIDSFAFIEKLMRAREPEEVVRLQTEFAQSQAQKLASQTKTLSDLAAKSMAKAAKT